MAEPDEIFQRQREAMVREQLSGRGIRDGRVLEVMKRVPRHLFVPEALCREAYEDKPLAIGWGQTISQPYIVAFMTEALQIVPESRVLEIGTGSGYQAAVTAQLAAEVYTLESVEPLYRQTSERLKSMGYDNITAELGDGWEGWPGGMQFERIMVTAAADELPDALVAQLAEGGRLICPVGKAGEVQSLKQGVKRHGFFEVADTIAVRFVPLIRRGSREKPF